MENNVVLKIIDADNELDFEIPINSTGSSPFSVDKQLSDLTNLTKRTGVQSKTFSITLTKDILKNYDFFAESQHHNYKDVDEDKTAMIIINGNIDELGKVRIIKHESKGNDEKVTLLFFGNNLDWTEAMKLKTMADLTWDTDSFYYNYFEVAQSFDNTVDNGDEWVFPLENRGFRKYSNAVNTEEFRPAFFVRSILTKVFKSIGYTVTGSFIDTDAFKKLVLTHFGQNFRNSQETIDNNRVVIGNNGAVMRWESNGTITAGTTLYKIAPLNVGGASSFAWDDSTAPNFDNGTNFDPTGGSPYAPNPSGLFTAPQTGYYKFNLDISGEHFNLNAYPSLYPARLRHTAFLFLRDANGNPKQTISGYAMPNSLIGSVTGVEDPTYKTGFNWNGEITDVYLKTGESAEVWFLLHGYDSSVPVDTLFSSWMFRITDARFEIELLPKMAELHTFNLSDVVDDKIKVLDILNDLTRMFNLFWDADTTLKTVSVEPRDDFYGTIDNAVDFTSILHEDAQIKTVYNSSFHKSEMNFAYRDDSADKFVEERDKELGTNLAAYDHNLPSKFKKGNTPIKTSVLAASYIYQDITAVQKGDESLAAFTTRYWDAFTSEMPNTHLDDHAPRILNYSYGLQGATVATDPLAKKFRFHNETSHRTLIPAVLPHQVQVDSTTIASAGFNLYWHTTHGQDGLYIDYWSKTVTEIINGKKVTARFLFDGKKWLEFNFGDLIYLEEPIEVKGYYKVEKIENYQPENSSIVKLHLLKHINYEPNTEGTTVSENKPIEGSDNAPIDSTPMTVVINDSNGNDSEVNMQSQNYTGQTTQLS